MNLFFSLTLKTQKEIYKQIIPKFYNKKKEKHNPKITKYAPQK